MFSPAHAFGCLFGIAVVALVCTHLYFVDVRPAKQKLEQQKKEMLQDMRNKTAPESAPVLKPSENAKAKLTAAMHKHDINIPMRSLIAFLQDIGYTAEQCKALEGR
jgi:hypothetical protein